MAWQPSDVELSALVPGAGVRVAVRGDAAGAAVLALIAGTIAPDAKPEDLDRPEQMVRSAVEHLASAHGVSVGQLAHVFERIKSRALSDNPPTGAALLRAFVSGPLSWPRRVLACQSIVDPVALLEAEDFAALPCRLDVAGALIDARTPLYSRKELGSLLSEFATHQERNAEALARTGHPVTAFARSPWIDIRLNKLYPVKVPVVVGETALDRRSAYDGRYVEGRRAAVPLSQQGIFRTATPPCPLVDEQVIDPTPALRPTWGRWQRFAFAGCGYEEADRLPELHDDDVEWIGSVRLKLHEVKVKVLADLAKALRSGKRVAVLDRVIRIVADRLDADDVRRLLRLDAKYMTYSALSDPGGVEPLPCMPGGFSALIELTGHVEKELGAGTLHRTREALGDLVVPDLLGRPRLRRAGQPEPYFSLAAGDYGPRWRSALDVYVGSEAEEAAFWTGFRGRLSDAIAADVPKRLVVPVKPRHQEVIEPAVMRQVREFTRELDDGVLSSDALRASAKGRRAVARFPHTDGLRWAEVTITFVSATSITITAREQSKRYTFAELGFADRRKGDFPDLVWVFLRGLARVGGSLVWDDRRTDPAMRNNAATYVTRLRDRLRAVVPIEDDPFENYKAAGGYKAKFKLTSTVYDSHDGRPEDE